MTCKRAVRELCHNAGDITNFLLTGTYSAPDKESEDGRPYLEAQAAGQVRARTVVVIIILCCSCLATALDIITSVPCHSSITSVKDCSFT